MIEQRSSDPSSQSDLPSQTKNQLIHIPELLHWNVPAAHPVFPAAQPLPFPRYSHSHTRSMHLEWGSADRHSRSETQSWPKVTGENGGGGTVLAASTSRSVLIGDAEDIHAPLVTSVSSAASTTIVSSESTESVGKKAAGVDRVSFLFSQAISTPVSSSLSSSPPVVVEITRSVTIDEEWSNKGGGLTRSSGRQTSASRRVGAVHWQRPNKFGIRKSQCEFASHKRQWACS